MGIFQLIFPVLTFCVAISCGGIQIAVSRFVAESKTKKDSYHILISSIIMSLILSIITSAILYTFSSEISAYIIQNSYCSKLLQYTSITIPFIALHSCITGYYLGLKKVFVPAWSTIFEQIIKVISLYILGFIWINNHIKLSIDIAVISTIISEASGAIFCLIAIGSEKYKKLEFPKLITSAKSIFKVSYILTLNKIMLTFLQCMEGILVPIVLIKYGKTDNEALSIYGILTGMAIPVITFPSAINISISSMILPTIATANTQNNMHSVKRTTELSVWFSMVTGIFCVGIFLFYGDFIGLKVFGYKLAGEYIQILSWLCPFMYLSITLGSILHGLGKTTAAFVHNVIGTAIRLFCLWFLVPRIGITGYLWGLLGSNLVVTLLHNIYIKKYVSYKFSSIENIFKPIIWLLYSLSCGFIVKYIFLKALPLGNIYEFVANFICAIIIGGLFFLFVAKNLKKLIPN